MAKQLVEFELAEGPLLVEVVLAEPEGERLPRRVEQSWREAEEAGAAAPSLEARRQALLVQSRCALVAASLNSRVEVIPPAVISRLVGQGLWTPAQALACARRIPREPQRQAALEALASYLPPPLREVAETEAGEAALRVVRAIEHEESRGKALIALVVQLPESLRGETLEVAQTLTEPELQWGTLVGLAPHLPEPFKEVVWRRGLSLAPRFPELGPGFSKKHCLRIKSLIQLAMLLPEPLLGETLALVQGMKYKESQRIALRELRPLLPESLRDQALAIIPGIEDRELLAKSLTARVLSLPQPLQREVLEEALARVMGRPDWLCWDKDDILGSVALQLARTGRLAEALAVAQRLELNFKGTYELVMILSALGPQLNEPLWPEALSLALSITQEEKRAEALVGLAPYLPEGHRTQALDKALAAIQATANARQQAELLAKLGPSLPEALINEALATAITLPTTYIEELDENDSNWVSRSNPRAIALTALLSSLPEIEHPEILQATLKATQEIQDPETQGLILIQLARHLPSQSALKTLQDALLATTRSYNSRQIPLALLIRLVQAGYPAEVLQAIQPLKNMEEKVHLLGGLILHLPEPLQEEALAAVQGLPDTPERSRLAERLALPLAQSGKTSEALAMARGITPESRLVQRLEEITPYLIRATQPGEALPGTPLEPEARERLQRVLARLPPLADGEAQAKALRGLSRYLPETLKQQVAATVPLPDITEDNALPGVPADPETKSQIPGPPALWNNYNQKTLKKLRFKVTQLKWQARLGGSRQAVAAVRAMADSYEQSLLLIALIPHLSPAGLEEALAVIQGFDDPRWQVETLAEAIVKLPEARRAEIVRQIVAAAGKVSRTDWLEFGLCPAAQRLAQVGYPLEALTLTQRTGRGWWRNHTLVELVGYLAQAGYLAEALEVVQEIGGERLLRGQALAKLGPYLTGPQWLAVLDEGLRLNEVQFRLQDLEQLAPHLAKLPVTELYPLWSKVLRRIASGNRSQLLATLSALGPVLVALGGPEAVAEQALMIVEVGEWFP